MIMSHRMRADKWYVSKAMAKDFGRKVMIEAYVFDGERTARKEEQSRQLEIERLKINRLGGQKAEKRDGYDAWRQAMPSRRRRLVG